MCTFRLNIASPFELIHYCANSSNLFQWLWSKILQGAIDEFRQYWNTHRVRGQANKQLPSGGTPNNILACPQRYGLENLSIPITDMAVVRRIRDELPVSRKEALRFVDDEFDAAAWEAYREVGSPLFRAITGWDTFAKMSDVLSRMYDSNV